MVSVDANVMVVPDWVTAILAPAARVISPETREPDAPPFNLVMVSGVVNDLLADKS